jgi:sulfoacetaldehyde dehydrogenase
MRCDVGSTTGGQARQAQARRHRAPYARARAAYGAVRKRDLASPGQARIDEAGHCLAWSIYKPENARRLAEIAVEVTGIGELESKVIKNQRKTFGTLRDLLRAKSTGIIEEIPEKGSRALRQAGRRGGGHHALDQSFGNARQQGHDGPEGRQRHHYRTAAEPPGQASKPTVDGMRAALEKIGLPADLVQILPSPVTREATTQLMEAVDLGGRSPAARSTCARPTSPASPRSASGSVMRP